MNVFFSEVFLFKFSSTEKLSNHALRILTFITNPSVTHGTFLIGNDADKQKNIQKKSYK
jgi:hypothetical protein